MLNTQKYIITLGNYDVPTGWPMKPYKRPYGGTPGPPVMYEKPSNPEDEGAGYGYHLDADGDIHIRTNTACLLGHSIENFYKAGLFQRAGESVYKFNKSIENHFLNAIKQSLCF